MVVRDQHGQAGVGGDGAGHASREAAEPGATAGAEDDPHGAISRSAIRQAG
ncbi:MAG TPA: hypothetical protein VIY52_10775 [Streptosporangiaceae bacterium]